MMRGPHQISETDVQRADVTLASASSKSHKQLRAHLERDGPSHSVTYVVSRNSVELLRTPYLFHAIILYNGIDEGRE